MDLFWWMLLGTVVGVIANWVIPTEGRSGLMSFVLLGMIGAVIGGYMVLTVALGHVLQAYFFWDTAFALGSAVGAVVTFGPLIRPSSN